MRLRPEHRQPKPSLPYAREPGTTICSLLFLSTWLLVQGGFLNRRWSTALMAAVTIQPFVHIVGSIGKWAFTEEVNHILTRQAIVNSTSEGTPCHIPRDNLLLE
jgi:hypothetical protein